MVLAALSLGLAAIASAAPRPYPDKVVTLIVPFPPGGVADTLARPLADALRRELSQTVIVENRGGAGGALGIGVAARAPADGYTLLFSLSSFSILPVADQILARKPHFQPSQFQPLARITADPTVLVVRSDAPWRTVGEFVADARRRPGKLNYGSSGNYGTMHVPMEMFKAAAGFQMTHVPFTGAGPAVTGLLGGQVDAIAAGTSSVLPYLQAGRLRALAHWGDKPLAALPDVPSLQQRGWEVRFSQWSGVFVPAGTPEPIQATLREALRKVAASPSLQRTLLQMGSSMAYLDAPAFSSYIQQDARVVTSTVRQMGRLE
ncbi:tripartite tricarboxylate transporter substrate binding protein [Mitsuaria sp. 7]|uniref:tripartite tricarboxylate transporter substrate binding protein n=1 Tax=Mitsuaria sp. 7 TaxID=1658665 RepID=UPI0007DCD5A5|nr:tripartite tricarboxylate transporter substrate binding protein [Mitsuaria sp. 7]ANH68070.1 Tat pathway signal protein [Mitsuaria sp. 7]